MWFRISLFADEFVKFAEKVRMRCGVPEPSQRQPVRNKKEIQK
ncbi:MULTISPECIES: hypothetical protein [Methanobrevibacter]|nr:MULTISPECIES: hypothetical protein [Methanobrevibacter]